MYNVIRLILAFVIGYLLFLALPKIFKNKPVLKYRRLLAVVSFLFISILLNFLPFENVIGFKSVQSAVKYEKGVSIQEKTILHGQDTALAIYKGKRNQVAFDTYYTKSNRWYLDNPSIKFLWCDHVSVTICGTNEQYYILVSNLAKDTVVQDSLNSEFQYMQPQNTSGLFCAPLSKKPSAGYRLVLNGQTYILQENGMVFKSEAELQLTETQPTAEL